MKIPLAGILKDEDGQLVSEPVMGSVPFCQHPDGCEFGICTWATDTLCYPHSMALIGEAEMKRRYEATHDMTWEDFLDSD